MMGVAALSVKNNPYVFGQESPLVNKLPRWKGFNLLDFFNPNPSNSSVATTEDHFKWMQDWGFDFVRFPMAYPCYLKFDRTKDITPEQVYSIDEQQVEKIDSDCFAGA